MTSKRRRSARGLKVGDRVRVDCDDLKGGRCVREGVVHDIWADGSVRAGSDPDICKDPSRHGWSRWLDEDDIVDVLPDLPDPTQQEHLSDE